MADAAKIQLRREQAFGAISSSLRAKVKGEDKPSRAMRQLRGLVDFRAGWDTSKLGRLDHALAVWAYDNRVAFKPDVPHAQDMLLARLVHGDKKGLASDWGLVLSQIRKNGKALRKAEKLGIRETARQSR